jgi:HPt (histidine-containing phosphotransfer) domain-containing protein
MGDEPERGGDKAGALLDRAHLTSQTMGDERLAGELLAMLLEQVEALPGQLEGAGPAGRAALGHRIAGAAANLGARPLEAAARRLAGTGAEDPSAAEAERALLGAAAALAAVLRAGGATPAAVDEGGSEP